MRIVVVLVAMLVNASVFAEGIRPCPVPLRTETTSCQQKLCPGPKKPL